MFFAKRKDFQSTQPSSSPQSVPPSGGLTTQSPLLGSVLEHYADIGQLRKVLTVGPDAVYKVPDELTSYILAIERLTDAGNSREAWIILPAEEMTEQRSKMVKDQWRQLEGALKGHGYKLTASRKALASVRTEIIKNSVREVAKSAQKGDAITLFNRWVDAAARIRASDIHVLQYRNEASVNVRVDGRLRPLVIDDNRTGIYSRSTAAAAVAAAYNYANQSAGSGGSQYSAEAISDCMIQREVLGERVLLRYQNIAKPSSGDEFGPKTVIRLLYMDGVAAVSTFERAGYSPSHIRDLREAARSGKGMVIIAGVTGSGKSTSLKLFIERLPNLEQKAIHTIEDPIEYLIAQGLVHQTQVTRDLADPAKTRSRYGNAVKAQMRADPDGVLIGEVRDDISARTALQMAETGHLAMFSLHAHLISNICGRLTNQEIGLHRSELCAPQILNLLVYQALVPIICPHCRLNTFDAIQKAKDQFHAVKNDSAADEGVRGAARDELEYLQDTINVLNEKFKINTNALWWHNEDGCEKCGYSGEAGRTIVAETMLPTRKWLELTKQGEDYEALMHYRSQSDGDFYSGNMVGKTVFEHALWKALQGTIDVRTCAEFESLNRFEIIGSPSAKQGIVPFVGMRA